MNASKQLMRLAVILASLLSSIAAKDLPYIQARVYFDSAKEVEQIRAMHPDIVLQRENYLEIVGFQDKLNEIAVAGFRIEIIHDDLTAFYQSRLDKTRDMGGYKTLSELAAHNNQVVIDHPDIARVENIGLSLEGRDMWAIKISDNPEIDEDEPEVLITGAVHAREVITPEIIVATIDMLTDGYGIDPLMTALVDNREIWFIPVINVDGYYYNEVIAPEGGGMWRKNRRNNGDGTWGVDLNRNFGYMWGYDDIGSSPIKADEGYRGTGPFSEPSTQNVRDFTIAHNFDITIHFHAYGSWFGPPWFYNYTLTPDESKFARLAEVISPLNGYNYYHGLMNGCHEDWDYGEQTLKNKCLSIIIEVGTDIDGFWPPLDRIPLHLDGNVPVCLFIAGVAGRVDGNFELPPGQPTINLDEIVESTEYQVAWDITEDPDNPVADYELREYPFEYGTTDNGGHLYSYEVQEYTESTDRYYSEPSCYHSGERSNSVFYMQTILPYEVKSGDNLQFWTYYDIQQHYDYAYVEISTDGVNFTPIQGNISSTSNPNGLNRGYGITGSPGEWREGIFDLSAYVGQEIYYRFSYYTDPYSSGEGIYIDDISPISAFLSENVISLIGDKNYTFIDNEAGHYAYKVRALDMDNQWGEFSDFSITYAKAPFVCADTDGDELVNILDIVYLINYIYKNGPSPDPIESADVNSDTLVNILDIVYIINYIYKGGPAPDCL